MFDLYYLENLYYWLHPARNDERIRYQHFYPQISSRYLRRISCIPLYLHGESGDHRQNQRNETAAQQQQQPISNDRTLTCLDSGSAP